MNLEYEKFNPKAAVPEIVHMFFCYKCEEVEHEFRPIIKKSSSGDDLHLCLSCFKKRAC